VRRGGNSGTRAPTRLEKAMAPPIAPYLPDDDLLAPFRPGEGPRARAYIHPETAVVLGRGSDPARELHIDACLADRVPIYRRRGGGCAVVLDPGNLVVSVALPLPGLGGIRAAYDRMTEWLIETLARCGAAGVRREGASDLARADRKLGGACIYRRRDLLLYSTTLLVAPDIDKVERYLQHPPREPQYRRGRTHREFMGWLSGKEATHAAPPDCAAHAAQALHAAAETARLREQLEAELGAGLERSISPASRSRGDAARSPGSAEPG
jgi:lipoate-protein ligase A